MTDAQAPFDPLAIIEVLNRHDVRFVVVGGIAAGVQGAMWATTDLDIVYARGSDDHRRLAAALVELRAEPIGLPDGVRVTVDARALAHGGTLPLATRFGRLDLLAEPAPGLSYEALLVDARVIAGSHTYRVASLADLIVMKQVAGRPKDRAHLDLLRATKQELRAR